MKTQTVVIKNCSTEPGIIKGGVPQGSVLGPLLFLLYINDIADSCSNLSRFFADDTSLSYCSNNVSDIETNFNSDLQVIHEWSQQWYVNFNPQKRNLWYFQHLEQLINQTLF